MPYQPDPAEVEARRRHAAEAERRGIHVAELTVERALQARAVALAGRERGEWVADLSELNVRIADGAIVLDDSYEFSIEAYPVHDLVGSDDDYGRDNLQELIRDSVARETWDEWEEPRLAFWGDLLVVKQTPAVHARLTSFLAALRRASR